jgi:FkbM family methyltransferase
MDITKNLNLVEIGKYIGLLIPSSYLRGLILKLYFFFVRGKCLERDLGGIRFSLDLDELIDASVNLGVYEHSESRALERYCLSGMCVFDIGANIGAHALKIAKLVGTNGLVYAFEPTEYASGKLRKNINLNPDLRVKAIKVALSDHNIKNQYVNFRSSWLTKGGRKDFPCTVDFMRLDDWVAESFDNQHVSLIKMDVDGNEFSIISGGSNLILRDRPIFIMEAISLHFSNEQTNPFLWLWNHGWRVYSLDRKHCYSSIAELAAMLPEKDPYTEKSINVLLMP